MQRSMRRVFSRTMDIEILKNHIRLLMKENSQLEKELEACKNTLKAFLMTYSLN